MTYADIVIAALITIFGACAIVAIREFFRWCKADVDRHVRIALSPTNAEADDYWDNWPLFSSPEFIETPIYAELRREEDVWFAASVMADLDDDEALAAWLGEVR